MLRDSSNKLIVSIIIVSLMLLYLFAADLGTAVWLQNRFGYYFCAIVFGANVYFLIKYCRCAHFYNSRSAQQLLLLAALCAVVFTYLTHLHEPFAMRVFSDEPGHLSTSRLMAEQHVVESGVSGYVEAGQYYIANSSISYRLYFYPFVVSLLHGLVGYAVANAYIVNVVATFAMYLALFALGRYITKVSAGGVALQITFLCLPLFSHVANSAAYDHFNLVLLAMYAVSVWCYLESNDKRDLPALDLSVALFLAVALTRSESSLFLFPLVCAFVYRTVRNGRLRLSWFASLSPLLLLPVVAARQIASAQRAAMEATYGEFAPTFFSIGAFGRNIRALLDWLFSFGINEINPAVVVYIGAFLVGLSAYRFLVSGKTNWAVGKQVSVKSVWFGSFVVAIVCHVLLLMFMEWGPINFAAYRFLLPFHLLLAVALLVLWQFSYAKQSTKRWVVVCSLMALCSFLFVTPKAVRASATHASISGGLSRAGIQWALDHNDGRTLFVLTGSSDFVAYEIPVVNASRFYESPEQYLALVDEGFYDQIVVLQSWYMSPLSNVWEQPRPSVDAPEGIVLEEVDRRRVFIDAELILYQVAGLQNDDGSLSPVSRTGSSRIPHEAMRDYFNHVQKLRN